MRRGFSREDMMKVIDYAELAPQKGIKFSRTDIRRKMKADIFPQCIKVGERRIAWIESEIDEYLARRAAARRPAAE